MKEMEKSWYFHFPAWYLPSFFLLPSSILLFHSLNFFFFSVLNFPVFLFLSKLSLPLISLSFSYFFPFSLTSNIKFFKEWRRKKMKVWTFSSFLKKWERRKRNSERSERKEDGNKKKRKGKKSVEACRWRVEDTFLIEVTFLSFFFLLSPNSLPLFSFCLMSFSNDILSLETKIMREGVKERKLQKKEEERLKERNEKEKN